MTREEKALRAWGNVKRVLYESCWQVERTPRKLLRRYKYWVRVWKKNSRR